MWQQHKQSFIWTKDNRDEVKDTFKKYTYNLRITDGNNKQKNECAYCSATPRAKGKNQRGKTYTIVVIGTSPTLDLNIEMG